MTGNRSFWRYNEYAYIPSHYHDNGCIKSFLQDKLRFCYTAELFIERFHVSCARKPTIAHSSARFEPVLKCKQRHSQNYRLLLSC